MMDDEGDVAAISNYLSHGGLYNGTTAANIFKTLTLHVKIQWRCCLSNRKGGSLESDEKEELIM